ncbi:MAG: D-alanine--D-alanine ligase [Vampirovibrio sp.]|nr:D-alanine--D-alanine ligase [Vampirovibrio sp.]
MKPLLKSDLTHSSRIGVLYGGLSSEREVSLRSGQNCFEALQRLGYTNVTLIDVDRSIGKTLAESNIEIAFLALHGKYGEDGCIQGILELMNIPYTGNDVQACAITMDKDTTKRLLKESGLPIISSKTLTLKAGKPVTLNQIGYDGSYPVMVKPITEGSSVGMAKVDSPEDLPTAVQEAANLCDRVMLEAFVKGRDLTVGVLHINSKPTVLPILELRNKAGGWYDFESKYTEGKTEFILPAQLSEPLTQSIQQAALDAHQVAGCYGISRTDFVLDDQNNFYILEINTIPGMTTLSDLPAQAKTMGISYDQLVEYILQTALPSSQSITTCQANI